MQRDKKQEIQKFLITDLPLERQFMEQIESQTGYVVMKTKNIGTKTAQLITVFRMSGDQYADIVVLSSTSQFPFNELNAYEFSKSGPQMKFEKIDQVPITFVWDNEDLTKEIPALLGERKKLVSLLMTTDKMTQDVKSQSKSSIQFAQSVKRPLLGVKKLSDEAVKRFADTQQSQSPHTPKDGDKKGVENSNGMTKPDPKITNGGTLGTLGHISLKESHNFPMTDEEMNDYVNSLDLERGKSGIKTLMDKLSSKMESSEKQQPDNTNGVFGLRRKDKSSDLYDLNGRLNRLWDKDPSVRPYIRDLNKMVDEAYKGVEVENMRGAETGLEFFEMVRDAKKKWGITI